MIDKPPVEDHTGPENTYQPGGWPGRSRLPLEAIVYHISQGTYLGSIQWSKRTDLPASQRASFNYIIAFDGRIAERVDPFGGHAPWANGISNPACTRLPGDLAHLADGTPNANWVTVSIEFEGKYDQAPFPTDSQYASAAHLTAWLVQAGGLGWGLSRFARHAWFDSCNRPNCPGPRLDIARIRQAALALVGPPPPPRRHFPETGFDVQGGFLAFWEARGGLVTFGFPTENEHDEDIQEGQPDGSVQVIRRTVQGFERYKMVYRPEAPEPWRVTGLPWRR